MMVQLSFWELSDAREHVWARSGEWVSEGFPNAPFPTPAASQHAASLAPRIITRRMQRVQPHGVGGAASCFPSQIRLKPIGVSH
jgi:hypothetical protein